MYQPQSLAEPTPTKSPRHDTRVRHNWCLHASEADDKKLAQFQAYLFQYDIIKANTKHALVRYAITNLLGTFAKLQEQGEFQALLAQVSPTHTPPPPVPKVDPVVAALEAQKAAIEGRLRALVTARQVQGGVSQ